jgi:hypothetical protein
MIMAMEKTTDWPQEKEAAAKKVPIAERIDPLRHAVGKDPSEIETQKVSRVVRPAKNDLED